MKILHNILNSRLFPICAAIVLLFCAFSILPFSVSSKDVSKLEMHKVYSANIPKKTDNPTQQTSSSQKTTSNYLQSDISYTLQTYPINYSLLPQSKLAISTSDANTQILTFGGNFAISESMTTFALSELDKLPKLLKSVQPMYPKEMLRKGIEGEVVLRIVIDSDGKVLSLAPEHSTNKNFETPAMVAVKEFIYEPPLKNGKAVRAEFLLPIPFKIIQ